MTSDQHESMLRVMRVRPWHSQVSEGQNLGFEAQAQMLLQFVDALGVDQFDLVGNDSGEHWEDAS